MEFTINVKLGPFKASSLAELDHALKTESFTEYIDYLQWHGSINADNFAAQLSV